VVTLAFCAGFWSAAQSVEARRNAPHPWSSPSPATVAPTPEPAPPPLGNRYLARVTEHASSPEAGRFLTHAIQQTNRVGNGPPIYLVVTWPTPAEIAALDAAAGRGERRRQVCGLSAVETVPTGASTTLQRVLHTTLNYRISGSRTVGINTVAIVDFGAAYPAGAPVIHARIRVQPSAVTYPLPRGRKQCGGYDLHAEVQIEGPPGASLPTRSVDVAAEGELGSVALSPPRSLSPLRAHVQQRLGASGGRHRRPVDPSVVRAHPLRA
jgi:hypothetical protein